MCFDPPAGGGGGGGGGGCGYLTDCRPDFAVNLEVDADVERFATGNGGVFDGPLALRPNGEPVVGVLSFGDRGSYVDGFGASDGDALVNEVRRMVFPPTPGGPDARRSPTCQTFPVGIGATAPTENPAFVLHRMRYTGEGLPRLYVDPANVQTELAYNGRRQLVQRRTLNPGLGEDRVTAFSLDADGNVTQVRYGSAATRASDGSLNVDYLYDGEGRLRSVTDTRGTTWQLAYAAKGGAAAVKQSTQPYGVGGSDAPQWQVLTKFDGLGLPVARDLHGLVFETTRFDAAGNPVEVHRTGQGTTLQTFDAAGRPVWRQDAAGTQHVDVLDLANLQRTQLTVRSDGSTHLTTSTIDTLDAGLEVVQRRVIGHNGEERVTDVTRDGRGELLHAVTHAGLGEALAELEVQRNLLGWPVQERDSATASFAVTAYDPRGLPSSVTDPAGQLTTMSYNAFAELTGRTSPGSSEQWAYDGHGRLLDRVVGGHTIRHEYDSRGDLVRQRWLNFADPSNVLTQRSYDALGRVVSAIDTNLGRTLLGEAATPVTNTFDYDALGRTTSESVAVAGAMFTTATTWTADVDGWWRDVVYPSGKLVSRKIDGTGRLTQVEVDGRTIDFDWLGELPTGRTHHWSSDPSIDPMQQSVTLDGLGRGVLLETTMFAGPASAPSNLPWADSYCEGAYDAAVCGAPIFSQEILRDALGRARSVQTLWGNPEAGPIVDRAMPWRGYLYDDAQRLSTVFEHAGASDPIVPTFASHTISNDVITAFVGQSPSSEPITPIDWVREAEVGGVLHIVDSTTGASRYKHVGPREPGHRLGTVELDAASYLIEHDTAGRVVVGAGVEITYDPHGRLIEANRGPDQHESYLYDAQNRLAMTINGKGYVVMHDGDQMIASADLGGQLAWELIPGRHVDDLLEVDNHGIGPGRRVPITDHRNAIVGWWNADTGQLDHSIEYTPHGRIKLSAPDGSVLCEEEGTGEDCARTWGLPTFGFAGAYRSPHTGLIYMRNRWYSPKLGQFLTEDPLGYIDSFNPYAYAGMDPINFWDPYGLASQGTAKPNIYDVSRHDKLGAVNAVRDLANTVEEIAETVGDEIDAQLRDNRKRLTTEMSECEGMDCVVAHGSAFLNEVLVEVLPQSGSEVMFDVATSVPVVGLPLKLLDKVLSRRLARRLARAAPCSSFTAGTVVLMCDGTYQPIEAIEEGEWVLAQDDVTGELACKQVVDPYANPDRSIIVLQLRAEDDTTEAIEATDNHPFYVADRGWTRVDELVTGDLIPSADGTLLTVVGTLWTDRIETVYNFGVDGFQSYFVGEVGAWVHNCWRGKIHIAAGDSAKGWTHIDQRHIAGTHAHGPGDLFAAGTTKAELDKAAQKVVDKGVRLSQPERRIQVFERRVKIHGKSDRVRVVVDTQDGSVITMFPARSN